MMACRKVVTAFYFLASIARATPRPGCSTDTLLDRAMTALGGEDAIRSLGGVTYHAPKYGNRRKTQSQHR